MMLAVIVVIISWTGTILADEVYRWQDEQGNVHFSNVSPKDSHKTDNKIISHQWKDARGRKVYSDRTETSLRSEKRKLTHSLECLHDITEIVRGPARKVKRKVVLLTARWCKTSKRARTYLKKNHISFVEYDIEKNKKGRALYADLPRRGLPVVIIGASYMFGFRADLARDMLKRSGYLR